MTRVWLVALVFAGSAGCGKIASEGEPAVTGGAGEASGAGVGGGGSSAGAELGGSSGAGAGTAGSNVDGSNSAGAMSTAGAPSIEAAVAECQHYCETLPNRLPQALCEDWRWPPGDPEFCHFEDPFTDSCADYCTKAYESVNPACAAVLPEAIRCIAPLYASGVFSPNCWLGQCRDQLYTVTTACYGLQAQLAAARASWEASGIVDYELDYESEFATKETRVVVRAGSAPAATPATDFALTVPALFDDVELYLHQPNAAPNVVYDPTLGYVTSLGLRQGCEERRLFTRILVTPLR